MHCEWEATFQVSPGVSEPETIGEYHFFLDEEKRTCVKIRFSTDSYRQQLPERSHGSEYAEEIICKQHIEKIKRLLLVRMVYQEYFQPINITVLKKPFLINRKELEESGTRLKRVFEQFFSLECVSIKTGDSLAEALKFYNQRAHLQTKDDAVLVISRWLECCESAPDEVEKFRILWTAFNTLFTAVADFAGKLDRYEYKNIKFSIGKLVSPEEAKEITAQFKDNGVINKLISFNIFLILSITALIIRQI